MLPAKSDPEMGPILALTGPSNVGLLTFTYSTHSDLLVSVLESVYFRLDGTHLFSCRLP